MVKITWQRALGRTIVVHQLYMTAITVTNLNMYSIPFLYRLRIELYCTWIKVQSSSWFEMYLDSSCTGVQSPAQTVQHPVDHYGWHAVPGAAGCSTLNKIIISSRNYVFSSESEGFYCIYWNCSCFHTHPSFLYERRTWETHLRVQWKWNPFICPLIRSWRRHPILFTKQN